jgi:hypothetical protein
MLAGASIIQSALSILRNAPIVNGQATAEEALLFLKRGLSLMKVDENHEIYELIKNRVHHSAIDDAANKLISNMLYEEFATVEYVMES